MKYAIIKNSDKSDTEFIEANAYEINDNGDASFFELKMSNHYKIKSFAKGTWLTIEKCK